MNRIKYILVFSLSIVLAGVLLGFAVDRSGDSACSGFEVNVLGDADLRFVTKESISTYVHDHGHAILGDRMSEIDTYGIEHDLMNIPFVEEVKVYKTINHEVHVTIKQRKPVVRLFMTNGESCYIDDKARFLQTDRKFSYKCMPVTGVPVIPSEELLNGRVDENNPLYSLWSMANYIQQDEFWKAQVMQVDFEKGKGAILIPRVGNHQIIMGDLSDYHSKLDKLQEFYRKGISQTNWNIYQSLDLRYKGQVVAVKR